MYINSSWQCNAHDRLSQRALLAMLFDRQNDEIQTIEILSQNGLPDGGSFKLLVDSSISQSIYYSLNYTDTLSSLRLALARITTISVSSLSATRFTVEFLSSTDVPQMQVYQNNLTLDGSPAGRIIINTKQNGKSSGSPYAILKSLPLSQWSIVSFDAKTRVTCVAIQKNNNWIRDTEGNLRQSPLILSIPLPAVY